MTETTSTCCDGRGWNLRDCRIQVCECGIYDDPPKWVKRGDAPCLIPHHKDPDRPRRAATGYVCRGHHDGFERMLAELPALYDDLGLVLRRSSGGTATFGGHGTETVVVNQRTGEEESPAWINDAIAEARQEVRNECVRMAREVAEGRLEEAKAARSEDDPPIDEARYHPRADDVATICRWLLLRLDWICGRLDVDDTFGYLRSLVTTCERLAYPSRFRRAEVGPCGQDGCPGTLWLRGETDEARSMSCDYCKRGVEPRYWRRERRRIDGVDVNPWLTLSEAAVQYGTTTRTVERWVAKGRLKARGSPMRVKASAVEALMRTFTGKCA
jgi:excisionase family DNA binding protein